MLVAANVGYRVAKRVDEGRLGVISAGCGEGPVSGEKSIPEGPNRVTERRFLLALLCLLSQVHLFRDRQSFVHFDAEEADGALKIRMP
ncbi:hypothetical protein [Mesorhizobium ventifaucium]|uniref:Uncharacterized protein n=1 Tax=Mesorhizobium ventifaucium TaxID=666020 RepID=A0ABN8JCM7_9HYPH|nr:hypothetical protein MES4922_140004 [Mesorhizobium ventifaucium]